MITVTVTILCTTIRRLHRHVPIYSIGYIYMKYINMGDMEINFKLICNNILISHYAP